MASLFALPGFFGSPWMTPGINPNAPMPGAGMLGQVGPIAQHAAAPQSRLQAIMDKPMMQIGLRMLANSRQPNGAPTRAGQALGNAVLGYQQQQGAMAEEDLRRKYMEAQIARMQQPEAQPQEPAQLQLIRALQANPDLMATYMKMNPASGGAPASLQEWDAFQKMTPDQQREYLNMKRQPAAPQLSVINGVPSLVDRISGNVNPLSTQQAEIQAASDRARAEAQAKGVGQARGEAQGAIDKKGVAAMSSNDTLDLANNLIDLATGSAAGAVTDKVSGWLGYAPKGAQATAELKILQANLMTSMPRMEGPQSDRDVQLYREAAGQIGDPTVPRETKKAAIRMIRQLNNKYIERANPAPSASGGSWKIEQVK